MAQHRRETGLDILGIEKDGLYCIYPFSEFNRLRGVFLRFRIHELFLKAKKCYFGYAEIDFVGKVLSEKGLQMSQAKIRSVLDFPKPVIAKQLKSFSGFYS